MKHSAPAFLGILLFFVLPPSASAQRPEIHASALAGTGLSFGMGAGNSVIARNATALAVQVMGANSERPHLRYGGSLRGELEGKVTFGVVPQISLLRSFGRISLGVTGGIPLIIAPKSLYGVEAGGDFAFMVLEYMSIVAHVMLSFYPLGNDLPEDSFLLMVQFYAGIQFHF